MGMENPLLLSLPVRSSIVSYLLLTNNVFGMLLRSGSQNHECQTKAHLGLSLHPLSQQSLTITKVRNGVWDLQWIYSYIPQRACFLGPSSQ